MRSQKQVRRVGKVRSLKNAAAGKWKTYRRHLEARKAWQNNAILTGHQHSNNILTPPPPTHRKIKEPKQRSPEELAERQRLREQRRLEKKLAKQRASTSTLPEIRKEKKRKEASSNGPPKKASAELKTAAKTTKAKKSTKEETAKARRLMNEQGQRTINVAQREMTAKKVNELKAMKVSKLEKGSKPKHQYLKEEKPVSVEKEERGQSSSPIKTANKDEQGEVHARTKKTDGISQEQKKKKNRRSDPNRLLSEHGFVEENTHGVGYEEAKADFTETVGRQYKKKERQYNEQPEQKSKREEFTGKARNENDKVTQVASVVKSKDQIKKQGEDILEPIEKQEKDISEKKENKGLNEAAYLSKDQSCILESTGFETEKIMDHVTLSSDKIPKGSETLSKTEVNMKEFIPEELEINMARLAEEHSKPLGAVNLSLSGGNITGDLTVRTYAKGAKCDVNVEKKEQKEPVVRAPQRDEVSRVLPIRERVCKLLPRDIQFCVHMIEKHGEDYEAMAKDQGNIFRDSAKGIARKIRIFKESPQYETYLKQKTEKNGSIA